MKARLAPDGTLSLPIPSSILEALGIGEGTEVDVTTEGHRLVITTAAAERERVMQSAQRVMTAHAETLRKLAR